MRILFVNQYYWPDVAATAQQLTDLAEFLAERGHGVHVLCSAASYEDSAARRPPSETRCGVRIHRLRALGGRKKSVALRLLDYMSFHALCGVWMLSRGRRFDAIVTLTEPPLVGLYATFVRAMTRGRVRHVSWSMDLYTDCLFALGVLKERGLPGRLVEWLNRLEMRRADAVVVLGECMRRRLLAKGTAPDRVRVIGVWNRADQLTPSARREGGLRSRHGLNGKFVVMYSGNAGRAHSFDAVCAAMDALKDDARIRFLFVGAGKGGDGVAAFARERGLANFVQLPYFPREQLNESLAMGDVHLVTMKDSMAGVVVPCKLYGIMAVGRPTVFVGPSSSTVATEVLGADAGVVVATDRADLLVAELRRLASDAPECERLGRNGRRFFLEEHEQRECCVRWADLLEGLAGAGRRQLAEAQAAPAEAVGSASKHSGSAPAARACREP